MQDVPLLSKLLTSCSEDQIAERTWLLRLLVAGTKSSLDGDVCRYSLPFLFKEVGPFVSCEEDAMAGTSSVHSPGYLHLSWSLHMMDDLGFLSGWQKALCTGCPKHACPNYALSNPERFAFVPMQKGRISRPVLPSEPVKHSSSSRKCSSTPQFSPSPIF